jgi:hypothetical protein
LKVQYCYFQRLYFAEKQAIYVSQNVSSDAEMHSRNAIIVRAPHESFQSRLALNIIFMPWEYILPRTLKKTSTRSFHCLLAIVDVATLAKHWNYGFYVLRC